MVLCMYIKERVIVESGESHSQFFEIKGGKDEQEGIRRKSK